MAGSWSSYGTRQRRVAAMGDVHAVLADLLVAAAERNRLTETDRLLRDLVDDEPVRAAHRIWTGRLRAAIEGSAAGTRSGPAMEEDSDLFGLLQALRETTPAPRGVPR